MTSNDIRLYRVRGTHYKCARDIGIACRELIKKRIENDRLYLTPMFNFVRTIDGLKLHQGFIEIIRKTFPWYWDEILGLADGSEIPLEQLLVLNFENETQTAYRLYEAEQMNHQQEDEESGAKGCSTVLINRLDTNTLSLVHNEDNTAGLYDTGYLIEADIKSSPYDNGSRHSPNERFIAYCYAGVIPGTICVALNYLNHFNHYERSDGSIVEREPLLWSRYRARRALEIGEIHTVKDALYLLGDRVDEKYPIFFIGGTTEINLATLCTAHFNFHTRQLSIYRNNPKDNSEPQLIFNLDDLLKNEFITNI
ncbi:unnamed protein product [Rotaria sp. Silwood1]|nr:unnamed protein product [Rotaria sp. Silwood1]CAF3498221.1 unnamed protein product [Rotaria sp. Silwood1]CAF3565011.1 unnamed protein product [Rotaria sp. Silwood1]CAF3601113.1 unnamed protein product [Rotaria sp. Silwood1]CAF3632789.1 unnamed protein product [Rotaria sp. Silwood1]